MGGGQESEVSPSSLRHSLWGPRGQMAWTQARARTVTQMDEL